MFISGGENGYPAEVEDALFAHRVAEGAAIDAPDKKWRQVGHAFVVQSPGNLVIADELREFLRPGWPNTKHRSASLSPKRYPGPAPARSAKPTCGRRPTEPDDTNPTDWRSAASRSRATCSARRATPSERAS
jgi:acyl-CoA synthetase (AMP-forming)/AMP-acid ligase II